MNQNLETRIAKLERWRVPRPPYVIQVSDPMTPADRAAIAAVAAVGRPVVVVPHKCETVEEWAARYTPRELK
jgi:hypothetical protein